MGSVIKWVQGQTAYLTGTIQGTFNILVILHVIRLSTTDIAAVEGFTLFLLLGWIHTSVTPNVKLPAA